jgi:hypothetical protein
MRPWRAAVVVAVLGAACATPRPAAAPVPAPAPAPPSAAVPESSPVSPPEDPAPSAASDSRAVFDSTVKPILVSSCMPCHFPGGKMYASMPFDDPGVVSSHSEGILRRIKAPEKRDPLESWLRSAVPR